jgi:hypothetical protein
MRAKRISQPHKKNAGLAKKATVRKLEPFIFSEISAIAHFRHLFIRI